jgi:hypothetical protein
MNLHIVVIFRYRMALTLSIYLQPTSITLSQKVTVKLLTNKTGPLFRSCTSQSNSVNFALCFLSIMFESNRDSLCVDYLVLVRCPYSVLVASSLATASSEVFSATLPSSLLVADSASTSVEVFEV